MESSVTTAEVSAPSLDSTTTRLTDSLGSRDSEGAGSAAERVIRQANQELRHRTDELLALPISILAEQRDAALKALEQAREQAAEERRALVLEQDTFITFLMEEQEKKLRELQKELQESQARLEQQVAASNRLGAADQPAEQGALRLLEDRLRAAQEEVEETRADACRLQEERDEAVRAIDDARAAMVAEVQVALERAFELQVELDKTNRQLEDARDEARDEAYRLTEELGVVRRELDERNEEVRRLRDRLAQLTEARHSRPPPAPAATDLDAARAETQTLRKQLIDAKRDLSRINKELELARSARVASRPAFGRVMVGNRPEGSTEYEPRLTPRGIGAPDRRSNSGK